MRLATLIYKNEQGAVRWTDNFRCMDDCVVKLDILSDWIGDLQAEYERVHAITFPVDESPTSPSSQSPTPATD